MEINPLEVIRSRKSSRTYTDRILEPEVKVRLLDTLSVHSTGLFGESLRLELVERQPGEERKMKFDYGYITNHHAYLLGKTKNSPDARMSYGYLMEKMVLEATRLGLSSCWMGYFDPDFFTEIHLSQDEIIPAIVIVGYAVEKQPVKERMIRIAIKASQRKSWDNLFFLGDNKAPLTPETAGQYAEVLEMTRLAPSSGNTQPWRIIREKQSDTFHFYKKVINSSYEERGMHDVDLGICMSHFEIACHHLSLLGKWEKRNPGLSAWEYKMSWTGE